MEKKQRNWATFVLRIAAIYNVVWGGWVVLFPLSFFRVLDLPLPNYPEIWQALGMVVGVYGIGYWVASFDPHRHWPIVFVGLLGKILGPIGFIFAATSGKLPWRFGILNITNDFIWLVPFAAILLLTWKEAHNSKEGKTVRAEQ